MITMRINMGIVNDNADDDDNIDYDKQLIHLDAWGE